MLLVLGQLDRIGGFISKPEAGLLVTQDAHENLGETDEHQRKAERHDQADVPLLDADVAQVSAPMLASNRVWIHSKLATLSSPV